MVYMYHSFLIHSSADGHLGCFHVLARINSAAMNIEKIRNASRICMSSLHRGHANLLCIVPILVYVLPKRALVLNLLQRFCFIFCVFGHKACGILDSRPGMEPEPLHWKAKS